MENQSLQGAETDAGAVVARNASGKRAIAGGPVWRVKNSRDSLLRSFISRTHPYHQVFIVRNGENSSGASGGGEGKVF